MGNDADLTSEHAPERPAQRRAEGDADDGPEAYRNDRLPAYRPPNLVAGGPERFQEGEVAAATPDACEERQAQGNHRAKSDSAPQQSRRRTHRPVVDDLRRSLHAG